jgi:hypothetical protein
MENKISLIADICGILGFIISLFAINGVRNLKKEINNINNSINQSAKGSGNTQSITTNKP